MIFDVQYSKLHTDYKIQNDKIGYKIHDHYNFNTNKGYLTQFAYIKESINAKVSLKSLALNSGLRVSCGNFSYANIADQFKYIMGVTGTLESISEVQTKIIVDHFKIYDQTFIPSVFGKNNLNFSST